MDIQIWILVQELNKSFIATPSNLFSIIEVIYLSASSGGSLTKTDLFVSPKELNWTVYDAQSSYMIAM